MKRSRRLPDIADKITAHGVVEVVAAEGAADDVVFGRCGGDSRQRSCRVDRCQG